MTKITIDKAVLENAIAALEQRYSDLLYDYAGPHHAKAFEESITALREALAQQSSRQVEESLSTVLEQPQLVPVYQYQLANGFWADQTKEHYDYNVRNGWATVRVLFTSLQAAPPEPQPEQPQPERQSVPDGYVLVPIRPTREILDVTDSEGWTWPELLAAAGSITEAEADDLAAPQPLPVQEPVLKVYKGDICYKSKADDQSYGMWCPVSYEYQHGLPDGIMFYASPQAQPVQPLSDELIDEAAPVSAEQAHSITKGTT